MGNRSSKKKRNCILTEQALHSLEKNTSFTREEILQWHEGFLVINMINLNFFKQFFYKEIIAYWLNIMTHGVLFEI